ncbi:hypothetical protein JCM10369A_03290 [Nocardioides pyridinolyticus]
MTVLLGAAGEADRPVDDDQVVVRRSDQDLPGPELRAVDRLADRQLAGTAQDHGEGTQPVRREVEHHEHGCPEIAGQQRHQVAQRLDTTGRGTDHDHRGRRC